MAKLENAANLQRITVDEILEQASKSDLRYIDMANDANINIYMRKVSGSGFIRVTTNPKGTKIISSGLNQERNVINGIQNGRLIKLEDYEF